MCHKLCIIIIFLYQKNPSKWFQHMDLLTSNLDEYRPGQPNWECCHPDFPWKQFWSFWSLKNSQFDCLSSIEFLVTFDQAWHFSKNQTSKPSKLFKMAVFDPLKSAKIDFTQNQSGRKTAKLHTVENTYSRNSQLDCPGLYIWLQYYNYKAIYHGHSQAYSRPI